MPKAKLRKPSSTTLKQKPPSDWDCDILLQRLSHVSQALLLALAVFGYFYTVVPAYKLAVTEEELSKKSLELNAAEARISKSLQDLESTRKEAIAASALAERRMKETLVLTALTRDCEGKVAVLGPNIYNSAGYTACVKRSIEEINRAAGKPLVSEDEKKMYLEVVSGLSPSSVLSVSRVLTLAEMIRGRNTSFP